MALPKLEHPTTPVVILSTGQEIHIRPFTVKEEKILLMARADKDATLKSIIDAVRQVMTNCIIEDINVDKLTLFDFEWIFLKLRAISVNNTIDFEVDDGKGKKLLLSLDIDTIEVPKMNENVIDIGGGVKVTMSHITVGNLPFLSALEQTNDVDAMAKVLWLTIVNMFDGEKIYTRGDDFDEKDIIGFVENLTSSSRDALMSFFTNSPTVKHTLTYTDASGAEKSIQLSGLVDFFTFQPDTAT